MAVSFLNIIFVSRYLHKMSHRLFFIITIPFLILLSGNTYAHDTYKTDASYIDIKAGCNLATWWGATNKTTRLGDSSFVLEPYSRREIKPGLVIGADWETRLFSDLCFRPEILFTMKGYGKRELRNDPLDSILTTVNLDYLEIPLVLKWRFYSPVLDYGVYLGPAVSMLVWTSGKNESTGKSFGDADNDYLVKYTAKFDCGAVIGGTIEKKLGRNRIFMDMRYTLGFVNINRLSDYQKQQGAGGHDLLKDKNGVFSIIAGYGFQLPGK
jgi:hypothetical protein